MTLHMVVPDMTCFKEMPEMIFFTEKVATTKSMVDRAQTISMVVMEMTIY